LVDLAGGLAQRLDLAPGIRTWIDLAGLADQPDDHALLAACTQPCPGLWALPLVGLVDGGRPEPAPEAALVRAVVAAGRRAFQVLVADLPPTAGPQVDAALELADVLLTVGRCPSAGVPGARARRWTCGRQPAVSRRARSSPGAKPWAAGASGGSRGAG
jgi:hypothetical protein